MTISMKYISGVMPNKFIHFQIYFLTKHKMKKLMMECSQVFLNKPLKMMLRTSKSKA